MGVLALARVCVCVRVHGLQERAATAEQARERLHQLVMDLEVVSSACMRDSLEMMHSRTRTHTHAHICARTCYSSMPQPQHQATSLRYAGALYWQGRGRGGGVHSESRRTRSLSFLSKWAL